MYDAWPFFSHRVLPGLLRSPAATVEFLAKTRSLLIWAMDLILDKLARILFFRRSKSIQTGRQEIRTRLYCLQKSIEKSSDTLRRDEFPRYRDYKTLYRNFHIAIYSSKFSFVSATFG